MSQSQTNREGFLTLRIAESLHQQLRATAERTQQSVSEVARAAIVDRMADELVQHQSETSR